MRGRNCFSCSGLKIHYIEGLVGRGNDVVALLKVLEPARKMFLFARRSIEKICKTTCKNTRAGNQRAGPKHLEEFSAGPRPVGRVAHTLSSSIPCPLLLERSVTQQWVQVAENFHKFAREGSLRGSSRI